MSFRRILPWVAIGMVCTCSDDRPVAGDPARQAVPRFEAEWQLSTGALAVDHLGNFHATNWDDHFIHVFSPDGQEIDRWAVVVGGDTLTSRELTFRNGKFLVTTPLQIVVLNETREVTEHWNQPFTMYGSFGVDAIDADRDGNVYVLHDIENIVVRYSPHGTLEAQWELEGRGALLDEFPGIAVADNGLIYISNRFLNRIEMYTSDGYLVGSFGSPGNAPGQFQSPWGLDIDGGVLYVVDQGNFRVQKLSMWGGYLAEFFAAASDGEAGDAPMLVSASGGNVIVSFLNAVAAYRYE